MDVGQVLAYRCEKGRAGAWIVWPEVLLWLTSSPQQNRDEKRGGEARKYDWPGKYRLVLLLAPKH